MEVTLPFWYSAAVCYSVRVTQLNDIYLPSAPAWSILWKIVWLYRYLKSVMSVKCSSEAGTIRLMINSVRQFDLIIKEQQELVSSHWSALLRALRSTWKECSPPTEEEAVSFGWKNPNIFHFFKFHHLSQNFKGQQTTQHRCVQLSCSISQSKIGPLYSFCAFSVNASPGQMQREKNNT